MKKQLPFDREQINQIIKKFPTPFYIYDEVGIQQAAEKINSAFAWSKGFKNYFAVKALPNPGIIETLLEHGMGLDCSSYTELLLAEKLQVAGSDIMFTSNDTAPEEFKKARELDAIINLDDISHLDYLQKIAGLPELLCFRYNPGRLVQGNDIIGKPEEAKFGMTKDQILKALEASKQKGVKMFGLHTMVISNNLDYNAALQIVQALFDLAREVNDKLGVKFEFINLGGGIGIPYRPNDSQFDITKFADGVRAKLNSTLNYEPKIYMECGRYITGPHGYLVSTVQHIKQTYKTYLGLDASMHNLMRPGIYGAYHHITVLGQEGKGQAIYDVTGSLCENNDKFAIDRQLPTTKRGDIVVIHDVGAHGHAMGFNYNGKLRSAELLLQQDGGVKLIRRAETPQDLFSTLV